MKHRNWRQLVRAVSDEAGILGFIGGAISTAKDIGGFIGDTFSDSAGAKTGSPVGTGVAGVSVCNAGPVSFSSLSQAWQKAPASARDSLWRQSGVLSDSKTIGLVSGSDAQRDEVRVALIAHLANGRKDCKMGDFNGAEFRAARLASDFIARWITEPSLAGPGSPSTTTTSPVGTGGAASGPRLPGDASVAAAGLPGTDTLVLVALGVALFLLLT